MIYQHIKGLKPIGINSALAYARAFNISLFDVAPELAEQLRGVPIFPNENESEDNAHFPVPFGRFRVRPNEAGFDFDSQHSPSCRLLFDEALARERGYKVSRLYAIPVDGREMEPTLVVGSTVVVNTEDVRRKDGGVFAINRAGSVVIRRLVKRGGVYKLFCDNIDLRGKSDTSFDERYRVIGRVIFQYGEVL